MVTAAAVNGTARAISAWRQQRDDHLILGPATQAAMDEGLGVERRLADFKAAFAQLDGDATESARIDAVAGDAIESLQDQRASTLDKGPAADAPDTRRVDQGLVLWAACGGQLWAIT
jgi:hypothetical protein